MKRHFYKHLDNPKMLMGMALSDLLSLAIPLYAGICLACHMDSGQGIAKVFPLCPSWNHCFYP